MPQKPRRAGRGNSNGPTIALVIGGVALVLLFGYAMVQSVSTPVKIGGNKPGGDCAASPVVLQMIGLERVPCRADGHVGDAVKVTYETDPPLSGDHFAQGLKAGWYSAPQSNERLVHSLEHGNVVIYYDKDRITEKELAELRSLVTRYPGDWDGLIAIPRMDSEHPVILTAWEHVLRLKAFDRKQIDRFVDGFRGRGPENLVR